MRVEQQIGLVIPILMFAYAIFCIVRGGAHVKGQGWKTKEEAPKSFYFTVILMIALAVSSFVSYFVLQK